MVTEERFLTHIYMNKFLCSLVFVLSFFSIHAQSQNSHEEYKNLVQKVDSLEHELSYLKLTYGLNTLKSDMEMFSKDIDTKSIEIQLKLYNRDFNPELGDLYQQYYKKCQRHKKVISEAIEAQKILYTFKVMTYPYSESELKALKISYDLINSTFESLEVSMDVLKATIDLYNESL